jgi:hypothetical protein
MAPSNLQLTLELKPISPRVYMGWNPERWIESYVSTSHAARSWPRFWLCSLEILDGYTILLGPRPTRHLSDASISSNLHCCVSSHRRPKPRHPHHTRTTSWSPQRLLARRRWNRTSYRRAVYPGAVCPPGVHAQPKKINPRWL